MQVTILCHGASLLALTVRQAHTMSLIASCDWPDEFPDLLNSLIQLISTDSPDSVHGSVQVLAEFIKSDLTEDQILPVLRQLLPALRAIFYEEVSCL